MISPNGGTVLKEIRRVCRPTHCLEGSRLAAFPLRSPIQFLLVRVGHGQSVKGIHVIGIFLERPLIGCHGLVELVLGEKLHPFVVVIEAVWYYSAGTPRLINIICDSALAMTCQTSKKKVSA
jgi:hypothetical protein